MSAARLGYPLIGVPAILVFQTGRYLNPTGRGGGRASLAYFAALVCCEVTAALLWEAW